MIENIVPLQRLKPAINFNISLPPLSLYIHVPWCVRKCPYCDFNSHEKKQEIPEARFLAALRRDLEETLPLVWGRSVYTVFIGGGTPSLLSGEAIEQMLAMVRSYLPLAPSAEITMEANPGTAEADRFAQYAAAGVNRFSLGVQSFDDSALQQLGRIHNARQAEKAIELAMNAVSQVNIDLMYALPGQTVAKAREDVQRALAFGTQHLSLYHLTMEPNTVFAKFPPKDLPDEDSAADIQDMLFEQTGNAGFEHYEISAYARPGCRARHNLNYWEFGDYIGIGPGAHGKLSFQDRIIRRANVKSPQTWMDRALEGDGAGRIMQEQTLAVADVPFEFMLNALRLVEGVPATLFEERTSLSLLTVAPIIRKAVERGLLVSDPMSIRPTERGQAFLNDLQAMFLPENKAS
ncbi:oxygen-independent coproporphyrinogen III oxidase [Advenella mimigardefordensis DPN7]|uniref:Heme chaperone HemW n=1 Tax=Advenella mimigardefordensis (strain DSM 17166 / LMG 22922 / DPN7) TaxID=1247726 RepID=W0PFX5_ADVMD|nr:radical SAM family heme chaperone HemW [Advenella mimigardefordensis]AHG63973.1 oxygen-independent coproporphyrinogen III oxidase [Advenella mimigardefordensis DPN7]